MFFASDNAGPAHPKVVEAIAAANMGYETSYGADAIMARVRAKICDIFAAPHAEVHLVATGTAANVLSLSSLCKIWDAIYCTPKAHIVTDECNAPEFFTGGAKLTLVGNSAKMAPDDLRRAIEGTGVHGVHGPTRGPISVTQVNEDGDVYTLDELQKISNVAREYDLPLHMDGARFANAVAALGSSAKAMTTDLGINALSFGGTKNGLLGVEAVVLFTPERCDNFERRRKRGAHLFSKHRYLSAQFEAYLENDLWLELATKANANAKYLFDGMQNEGIEIVSGGAANLGFAALPSEKVDHLLNNGAKFYSYAAIDGKKTCRFVCDWSLPKAQIDEFLNALRNA